MYAVIETGGKQYRVAEGDVISVEKIPAQPGETVEFDRVLMLEKDGQVSVGQPLVPGAKAQGKVLDHGKEKKILVFHYRAKENERKRYGHRQPFTRVLVEKIEG